MPQANIRNDAPTAKVRNVDTPLARSRYSSLLIAGSAGTSFGGKGYLFGMLGLTMAKVQTTGATVASFKSDDIPLVRIRNTD